MPEHNIDVNTNVDTLFHSLENFTQKEGLIGKPVSQGDKTFLPVVSITLGYGTGNTSTKGSQSASATAAGNMSGGALGLGAKLSTDAIIVIDKNNVSMLPMNGLGGVSSQIIDKIPQILMGNKQQGQQAQQNAQQGQ
ncbi:MAG: sporulation protein [Clostridiales bacterium 43-6]|nr:MAG: sporulation protein [Clostridiales bacterium 43-6]